MMKCFSSVILFFFILSYSFSQTLPDYQWWADAHNWDGVTHWSRYIKRLPAYMGPNALPIPEMRNAKVGSEFHLETSFEYHKGEGEYAANPYFYLNLPVVKEKVALDFVYRPFEYYETEEFVRFERHGRNQSCKGYAKSDLYIATLIQLLTQEEKLFDARLRIMLKTTTGKDFANARHTDAPGYCFDVILGKSIYKGDGFLKNISIDGMAGLFVWQMEFDNNRQNDAFLYGIKSDLQLAKPIGFSAAFSGYSGYMNFGDSPMAFTYTLYSNFEKSNVYLLYRQGLQDIIPHSIRFGLSFIL